MTNTERPSLIVRLVGGPRDGEDIPVTDPKLRTLELIASPALPDDPVKAATEPKARYRRRTRWEPNDDETIYTSEAIYEADE